MPSRIMTLLAMAGLLASPASGQTDRQESAPTTPYVTDYEVSAWSANDRRRKLDYLEQQYLASDELLGGPVAKPGEITFMQRDAPVEPPVWAPVERRAPAVRDRRIGRPNLPDNSEN